MRMFGWELVRAEHLDYLVESRRDARDAWRDEESRREFAEQERDILRAKCFRLNRRIARLTGAAQATKEDA